MPDLVPSKIPLTAWVKRADPASRIAGSLALSWEVSWDRSHAAIGVAGYRADGLPHVELIEYRQGTEWLPGRFGELVKRHNPAAVVYNPSGPGASMLTEVTERLPRTVEPIAMTARDLANACGRIYDEAVTTGRLRHLGDDRLLEMLRKSAVRPLVDAWAWDLKAAAGDISGLSTITAALHGLVLHGKPPAPAPEPLVESNVAAERFDDLFSLGF